jgi:hypothetical protein
MLLAEEAGERVPLMNDCGGVCWTREMAPLYTTRLEPNRHPHKHTHARTHARTVTGGRAVRGPGQPASHSVHQRCSAGQPAAQRVRRLCCHCAQVAGPAAAATIQCHGRARCAGFRRHGLGEVQCPAPGRCGQGEPTAGAANEKRLRWARGGARGRQRRSWLLAPSID